MAGSTSFPPDAILRINEQLATLLNAMAAATPTTEPTTLGSVWRNNGVLTFTGPLAETLAYQSRVVDAGGSLDNTGLAVVDAIFRAANDNGVTIASGWLFGSRVNAPTLSRQINLNPAAPDMVPPVGGYDPATNIADGMIGVRCSATQGGPIGESTGGMFDNSTNYNVLFIGSATGDEDGASQKFGFLYRQGLVVSLISNTGSDQWYDNFILKIMPVGIRDSIVQPMMHWVESLANGTKRIIHPGEEVATTFDSWSGSQAASKVEIGAAYLGSDVGVSLFLRLDGVMSDAQRKDFFDKAYAAMRKVMNAAIIVGNSVTDGANGGFQNLSHLLQKWGIHNNMIVLRQAEGARRLPYFAPTGYSLPDGVTDSPVSGEPVNISDWFAANLIINDEQQNAIANSQTWETFLHTHNAIVDYFSGLNPQGVRAVICTFMPYAAYELGGSPLTYAQVAASSRMLNLVASQAARLATSSDFNDVPTELADIYAGLNLGWDVAGDGDAFDPVNDAPNGNPIYFNGADFVHPNVAGHAKMFEVYRDAIIAVTS